MPPTSAIRPIRPIIPQSMQCLNKPTPIRLFSTSPINQVRKKTSQQAWDKRITLIRQHLFHPRTPRPLRLSRHRYMRHWTIAEAAKLHFGKQAAAHELELQRAFAAMSEAASQLRMLGDDGVEGGQGTGRRYRESMNMGGIWDGVPREYARSLVDWPSGKGWNYGWKRVVEEKS